MLGYVDICMDEAPVLSFSRGTVGSTNDFQFLELVSQSHSSIHILTPIPSFSLFYTWKYQEGDQ